VHICVCRLSDSKFDAANKACQCLDNIYTYTHIHTHTHTCEQLMKGRAKWHLTWHDDPEKDDTLKVKREVSDWLRHCHKTYDIEICIEGPTEVREMEINGKKQTVTMFTKMRYGHDKHYKKTDKLRIRPQTFGEIMFFTCEEKFDRNAAKVTKSARIWYQRMPWELFADEIFSEEVTPKIEPVMTGQYCMRACGIKECDVL
jgi:hypothetical protein